MASPARKHPPFSGQLVKVTGEGEQVTLAFTAATVDGLRHALAAAGAVALERVKANNEAILNAASVFEERQAKVYAHAVAQLRREMGLTAPPGDDQGTSHADDSAGPIHAAENP
jgi:hypothetical protein